MGAGELVHGNGAMHFSVRGFSHALFILRKKDDYETIISIDFGAGYADWHGADEGTCYRGGF